MKKCLFSFILQLVILVVLGLAVATSEVLASEKPVSGKIKKYIGVSGVEGFTCTNDWMVVEGMEVKINHKGGLIIILFSGEANGDGRIRATVDDQVVPGPGTDGKGLLFFAHDGVGGAHAFNFFHSASKGKHTVAIECRDEKSDREMGIDERTLIVGYR